MSLTLQPILVATGEEGEGCLVFRDGWLVAVLVRLSEMHEERSGCWFLEKGFGALDVPGPPAFENLDTAQDWIVERLNRNGVSTGVNR
jgi:hypothetical protein